MAGAVNYVQAGDGPVLLLIHGIAGTLENWQAVIETLARQYTVVAPDLPGHGGSAPSAGDYSLGALATGLRDLLIALGHERATLVGHSLGGGIAMQFTYQFPEMAERLVLVSSGGLGPEVSALLRAAALPGADQFIAATAALGNNIGPKVARGLRILGLRATTDVAVVAGGYASLVDRERRAAFLATLHGVVGTGGQRFTPATGSTSRTGCLSRSSGATAIRSSPSSMPGARTKRCRAASWRSSKESGICRSSRRRTASSRCSSGSSAENEPAQFEVQQWRRRLRVASGRQ